jgi:S-disulfanyl-L-cysteine oxidoreductase SoxD
MFTRNCLVGLAGLCFVMAANQAMAVETPHLGVPVKPEDIAPWDRSISPDGAGLPPGKGTAVQGKEIFALKCSGCHGAEGVGKPADRLVGGVGSLATDAPIKTVGSYWPYATTLFDYVRRAMPLNEPQSLTDDEVYAVSAYVLFLNGLVGEKDQINAKTLPKLKMPNRDNFFVVYPGNLK